MEKLIKKMILILLVAIIIIVTILAIRINKHNMHNKNIIKTNEIQNEITNQYLTLENDANEFEFMNVSDQTMSIKYLLDYKEKALYDIEKAYEILDEEYRQKRFADINEYKNYIQKHKSELEKVTLKKYQVKEYDKYTQYVIVDQYDNYYIIKETAIMQYTIILDTYTIDLPEYTEKYAKADEQEKTAYCIDRFMKAINDENYKFAYGLLADGFKNNYFKTQESFENYAKQYLVGRENVTFKEFKNEGNVYYTYSVTLNNAANSLEKTFILKLGEGTDFELSFNVN